VLELWRERSGDQVLIRLRATLPPHREGPPLHVHHIEDEEGVVTTGTLSAEIDGQRFTFGPGETVRLPHGIPHRWWNDGDELLGFEGSARTGAAEFVV
jgi:quercetin dioxygenase-like cupin family protein